MKPPEKLRQIASEASEIVAEECYLGTVTLTEADVAMNPFAVRDFYRKVRRSTVVEHFADRTLTGEVWRAIPKREPVEDGMRRDLRFE